MAFGQVSMCDVGPIRPPSEAMSLLIRVTRNCPWNKCAFCPVYKGSKFGKRAIDEVIAELDLLAQTAQNIRRKAGIKEDEIQISPQAFTDIVHDSSSTYDEQRMAVWMQRGGRHVFLQDADSLVRPPAETIQILKRLYEHFPSVDRVTTYARSRTLAGKTPDQLAELREAGLTRIHVGFESGSDEVLKMVKKGLSSEHHIKGCRLAIDAGFEVCCYVMPGLGGKELSRVHAEESARVLKVIEPQHIRLRTLQLIDGIPLYEKVKSGELTMMEEEELIEEILILLRGLEGANSKVVSDHDHNLLMEVEGHVTRDAGALQEICTTFLGLPSELRDAFVLARRSGYFRSLNNFLSDPRAMTNFTPAAQELRRLGGGSLLKGIMTHLSPRLL